jgi:DNA-binding transcriptional regulator YiaG
MTKSKRNIGIEILEGIREIKRAEHGRVISVPPVSSVRESTGLSQSQFASASSLVAFAACVSQFT